MRTLLSGIALALLVTLCAGAQKRFIVEDISDPQKAEENAFSLQENWDDLWRGKEPVSSTTSQTIRAYSVTDLDDPGNAEANAFAINSNFEDLFRELLDVSTPSAGMKYEVEDILNPELAEENTAKINELTDDLFREKVDK